MDMEFKNYCIVALGDIDGIVDIIKRVSENAPRKLEQTGVLICTFSSIMTVTEIKETINTKKRTFFIFEVGSDTAAYRVGREDIHDQLFGHIDKGGDDLLSALTSNLMHGIRESSEHSMSGNTRSATITEDEEISVSELSKPEIQNEIDKLLDKGFKNLGEKERERLELLTKNM
jgi:hypothetical protein